ncbi:MAG: apolipoprotein N-acyltransferase, partial [Alphaproteobacteria bacterium]
MALSMPPFDFFPLLWVCFPALIFLLQGTTNARQAFVTGWSFAFGFLVFGLYWIAVSMFVDLAHFWWAVPLAVAGLPACFAIYYGIAAVIARRIGLSRLSGAITFGLLWFLADYARGHLFTGFPWNLTGYAWSGVLPVLQVTGIFGIYGLTLLTTVAACLPASVADTVKAGRIACVASLMMFAVFAIGGEVRLQTTSVGTVPDVHLRLVQPNIAQTLKMRNDEREPGFQTLLDLSSAKSDVQPTHIFWPETASTYYLSEDADHRQEIAARIPSSADVITGVVRRELDENGDTDFYNSLVVVDGLGRLVGGYDKAHLVPFGEFMPERKYIPFIKAVAASDADFSAGPGVRSLRVLGLPLFSPLICYEAIFPGDVVAQDDRPGFMVNLTNDAWYGNTTGPYQHFAIVRVRTIEEGLPLIRIANTGISGVIDPLGRIVQRLGLGKRGFIDSDLPNAMSVTFFSKWREAPLWSGFLILVLTSSILTIKRK